MAPKAANGSVGRPSGFVPERRFFSWPSPGASPREGRGVKRVGGPARWARRARALSAWGRYGFTLHFLEFMALLQPSNFRKWRADGREDSKALADGREGSKAVATGRLRALRLLRLCTYVCRVWDAGSLRVRLRPFCAGQLGLWARAYDCFGWVAASFLVRRAREVGLCTRRLARVALSCTEKAGGWPVGHRGLQIEAVLVSISCRRVRLEPLDPHVRVHKSTSRAFRWRFLAKGA